MFEPNPIAVANAVERLTMIKPGGYRDTLDDACFFAWDQAFSYDMTENGYIFWRAVYDILDQRRRGNA
jgi:hypothetical protein